MPDGYREMFDVTGNYVRVIGNEDEGKDKRFARARTGKKENPEALAGVHSMSLVMLIADEASGVEDAIFSASVGALTSPNWLMILISNPTRLTGTFYKSHKMLNNGYQKLAFSGLESPVVNQSIVEKIVGEHWQDSDDYRIRVLGEFPEADAVLDWGWIRLIQDKDIRKTIDWDISPTRLGVDPAGTWGDESIITGRDTFKAKILGVRGKSTAKKDANDADTLMTEYNVIDSNVFLDNFGVGANVSQELALKGKRVKAINVGEVRRTRDKKRFTNPRAEMYWRMREWLIKWGELVNNKRWDDLTMIYYRRNTAGKIEIMNKKDMKKKFWKSPDAIDALAMTFLELDKPIETSWETIWEGFSIDYSDEL